MRWLERSVTYTFRVAGSNCTPCTASNVPGRVSLGGVPPLRPVLGDRPELSLPSVPAVTARIAGTADRADRRVAKRWSIEVRQLGALEDEDPIGTLGEDPLDRPH